MNIKYIITSILFLHLNWVIIAQKLENHAVADKDGTYHIFWSVDGENITFEVQVATKGYVGFGFSPNGGMTGSDIVIGWVLPNGQAYFHDRHAIGFSEPLIDTEQNYNLMNAYQNETHTVLRFTRKLNTCDKQNDSVITDSTMKIIFAWHPEDPQSVTGLENHGPDRRGAKSILLLSPPQSAIEIPDDATLWEIQMPNITLSTEVASIWCVGAKLPPFTEPHYYIGFNFLMTPGNENIIHHIVLMECERNSKYNEDKYEQQKDGYECTDRQRGNTYCEDQVLGWSPGRQLTQFYPKGVGKLLGEEYGGPSYFTYQLHFNNLEKKQGIVDSTKVQVYLTKNVIHQSGVLQMRLHYTYTSLIPPKQPGFKISTYCPSECTSKAFPEEGINVFAVRGHAHLTGRKILLRHFRDKKELKPISAEDNYDFQYQEARHLRKTVKIMPGDMLLGTCEYSSMDKNETVIGGTGTEDEMCVFFMYYYPIADLTKCLGSPSYEDIIHYFGVDQVADDKVRIISPSSLQNQSMIDVIRHYDWTAIDDAKLQEMISIQYDGEKDIFCENDPALAHTVIPITAIYPTDSPPYIPPPDGCDII